MARTFSTKFLNQLAQNESATLGVELGRLCVDAGLSATHIAEALEVSKTSVYSWFRGAGIREKKLRDVESLMRLLKQDMQTGALPVKSIADARRYIKDITSA